MKKRLLSLLVSLCLLLSVFPVSASAASYSGSCGKNVNYSLVNGVMTISGTGAMSGLRLLQFRGRTIGTKFSPL